MKKIAQMKKDELIAVAIEHEIEVDESMTKAEIKAELDQHGIDDEVIEKPVDAPAEEEKESEPAETEDEVLIKMIEPSNSYKYGKHRFTRENPFAVMKKEDADRLLSAKPHKFAKATPGELKGHYR